MSTTPVEVAEEADVKKSEEMKVVDGNTMECKKGTTNDFKNDRRRFSRLTDEERRRIWEEEQMSKKVLESGLKGRVKWYSVLGHYGFISRADGKADIFVHQSAIAKSHTEKFYLRTLADQEEVEFDIVEGRKGPEASNVTGPNGGNVKGSKYQRVLLYRFRPNRRRVFREKQTEKRNGAKSNEVNTPIDGDTKKSLQGKKQGRRFRGRRNRQPPAHEIIEEVPPTKNVETPEKVEVTTFIKQAPRRRGNYYNRRFRRQKIEPKPEDDVNHEKMNASNSSGMAAESENGQDEDPKAGIRRQTECEKDEKEEKDEQLKMTEFGGGDAPVKSELSDTV